MYLSKYLSVLISFHPHNKPRGRLLPSFYRWVDWGLDKWLDNVEPRSHNMSLSPESKCLTSLICCLSSSQRPGIPGTHSYPFPHFAYKFLLSGSLFGSDANAHKQSMVHPENFIKFYKNFVWSSNVNPGILALQIHFRWFPAILIRWTLREIKVQGCGRTVTHLRKEIKLLLFIFLRCKD